MQRLLLAAALLAFAGLAGRADEPTKEDKKEEKKASLADLQKEFFGKWNKSKPDEKEPLLKEYGPRFLGYAEENVTKDDAIQALSMSLQIYSMVKDPKATGRAVALVKKSFLDSKKLPTLLPLLGSAGKEGREVIRGVREKAEGAQKKQATLALLSALEGGMLEADGKETKEILKELEGIRKIAVDEYKMKDLFIGSKLPDLKSENLEGKEEKLSQYKGKVVVLDIWATWCPPCRAMIPHERELVKRLKDKPFALISVSFDDKKETLTTFLEKEKMPWTHWWNGRKGEIGGQLSITSFPTIFVLDAKGVIRFKNVREKQMDKAVEKLLQEIEDEKKSSE